MSELNLKLAKIHDLLDQRHLDAIFLTRVSSFAWATGGARSYINTASSTGEASLLITKEARYLITNNIEAPHYDKEEQLKAQGWDFQVGQWYEPGEAYGRLTKGLKVGADMCIAGTEDLSAEIATLRMNLLPEEQARFRSLGKQCAEAMEAASRKTFPGINEMEIAGLISKETFDRAVQPVVVLVATDERIFGFRHPLPVDKKMEKYAMLILCGRKDGLICSVTRLVHVGPLSDELKEKQAAVAQIDATVNAATRPGKTMAQVFGEIQQAYTDAGYPEEWKLHHQGGSAGYEPREFLNTPQVNTRVEAGQAYAWNPSITGCKSEDTILVTPTGFDVLTDMPNWPMLEVQVGGKTYRRPAILEI